MLSKLSIQRFYLYKVCASSLIALATFLSNQAFGTPLIDLYGLMRVRLFSRSSDCEFD